MQSYNHTILIFYTHNRPWSWCEWYYGNFHGIFKTPDDSGDDKSDDEKETSEQMSADHKMALDLQQSLNSDQNPGADDVVKRKRSDRNCENDKEKDAPAVVSPADAPGVDRVDKAALVVLDDSDSEANDDFTTGRVACKRKLGELNSVDNPDLNLVPSGVPAGESFLLGDKCYIASKAPDGSVRFRTCFVKARKTDILTGLVTHYDVALGYGNAIQPPTRCLIEAVQAHEVLKAHSIAKQKRLNEKLISRQEEQEALRLQSAESFRNGDLVFVPGPSPGNSPSRQQRGTFEFPNELDYGGDNSDMLGTFGEPAQVLSRDADDEDPDNLEEAISEEDDQNVNLNESAIDALQLSKSALTIELSTISATEIWEMFVNKKLKGGIMARSLFITAKALESKICDPWIGDKQLGKKKAELADQRKEFLNWTSSKRVMDWIRLELFKIVVTKPQTYKTFNVTHANCPKSFVSADGKDVLAASQASDNTMARVAHLACSSDSRVVLNMIFGSKALECIDSPDLQPAALWQDLATVYVNNPNWEIQQIDVLQLQQVTQQNGVNVTSSLIDVFQVPVIGVTAECVRLVFTEVKAMWTDLAGRVFKRTGCNSEGEELYAAVWQNFIKGKYLFFARPEVCMYVFKLWHITYQRGGLPKYCNKELSPESQVRMGVSPLGSCEKEKFALPTTPRGSSALQMTSPTGAVSSSSSGPAHSMEVVSSYLVKILQKMDQDDTTAGTKAASVAPEISQVHECCLQF